MKFSLSSSTSVRVARLCVTVAAIGVTATATAATASPANMGPLMLDYTALDTSGGGCVNEPGDSNAICTDVGTVADAQTCSNICLNTTSCNAMTFHGPTTQEWAFHCVLRLDGVWVPRGCGTGCDHTSANKTSGWAPYVPSWLPTTKGYTSRVKPFWFGANSSGLDNLETLELLAAHSVAGYGWQTGADLTVGVGESHQTAATTHLNDYLQNIGNPNTTMVFQYRQVQVALRLFAIEALAAEDPTLAGYFLHDQTSGAMCLAGQPWGTQDPYWDWTNQSAIEYWVANVMGQLGSDPSLTEGNGAVFFDECDQGYCGYRAGSCNFAQFNATEKQLASITMFGQMVRALNGYNIIPILSLDNRMTASSETLPNAPLPCAVSEDALIAELAGTSWVRFYETFPGTFWASNGPDTDASMIQNAILEAEAGVPNVLHQGGACPAPARNITRPGPLGGDVEFQVAVYLIVQSPGTTLSISNDWYDQSFCWRPDWNVDFGTPVAAAVRTSPYTWYRNYTQCNVEIDVSKGRNGNVYLL